MFKKKISSVSFIYHGSSYIFLYQNSCVYNVSICLQLNNKNVKYEFIFSSISHFLILADLFCSSPLNSVFNHYQCESNLVAQLNYL